MAATVTRMLRYVVTRHGSPVTHTRLSLLPDEEIRAQEMKSLILSKDVT